MRATGSVHFHDTVVLTYHENRGTRWLQIGDGESATDAAIFVHSSIAHRELARQLREAADGLDAVAGGMEQRERDFVRASGSVE